MRMWKWVLALVAALCISLGAPIDAQARGAQSSIGVSRAGLHRSAKKSKKSRKGKRGKKGKKGKKGKSKGKRKHHKKHTPPPTASAGHDGDGAMSVSAGYRRAKPGISPVKRKHRKGAKARKPRKGRKGRKGKGKRKSGKSPKSKKGKTKRKHHKKKGSTPPAITPVQ